MLVRVRTATLFLRCRPLGRLLRHHHRDFSTGEQMRSVPTMTHDVFVYGTLKRGFHNHPAMEGAEFLGSGTTAVRLPLVADEYFIPYLLNREGEGEHVRGEVYRVDDAVFAKLDRLENYPAYYDRQQLQVVGPELAAVEGGGAAEERGLCCWVYIRKEATAEQHRHT